MRNGLGWMLCLCAFAPCEYVLAAEAPGPVREPAMLKKRIAELREQAKRTPSWASTVPGVLAENQALQDMIALGPPCLPYLLDAVKERGRDEYILLWVAAEILKVRPPRDVAGTAPRLREWLHAKVAGGVDEASKEFASLKSRWDKLKNQTGEPLLWYDRVLLDPEYKVLRQKRELTDLGKVYVEIQQLGVQALPALMDELRNGEYDFLPIVRDLTNGAAHHAAGNAEHMAKTALKWWAEHGDEWTVAAPNPARKRGPEAEPPGSTTGHRDLEGRDNSHVQGEGWRARDHGR